MAQFTGERFNGNVEDLPWRVFAIDWEDQPGIDECAHVWVGVPHRTSWAPGYAYVDKCERCGSPRCQRPGCRDRRHHDSLHIFEDGSFDPVGGYLDPEGDP